MFYTLNLLIINFLFCSYLETLLSYSKDAKEDHLRPSLYFKESYSTCDNKAKTENNTAYDKREKLVRGSAIIPFSCQPHIDFFNTPKYVNYFLAHIIHGLMFYFLFFFLRLLPPSVNVKVRLLRNSDAFSILATTPADYKIKILNLELEIKKIVPSQNILKQHEMLFKNSKAKFAFNQTKMTHHLVSKGTQNITIPQICSGILPKTVFVFQVDHIAFNGSENTNPFIFSPFGLQNIIFKVNGQHFPSDPYNLNFSNDDCIRAFSDLYHAIGIGTDNASCDIKFDDFKKNCAIFAYDGNPDGCNGFHLHQPRTGIIDLSLTWSTTLSKAITVCIYAVYDR